MDTVCDECWSSWLLTGDAEDVGELILQSFAVGVGDVQVEVLESKQARDFFNMVNALALALVPSCIISVELLAVLSSAAPCMYQPILHDAQSEMIF